ncbi:hypothetical protein C2G38_2220920 [Gigaspora rosea]|uniref:Uncharacterized protein n=1 Tax=Gigaspora rosea TaxID=44941 RepID=A0A397U7A9_9GLOM|nr:hypothetical protein C2G38_2220920 [Gigaspora rosea]
MLGKDSIGHPSAQKIIEILAESKSDEILKNQSIHIKTYSDIIYKSKFIEFTASFLSSELNNLNIEDVQITN